MLLHLISFVALPEIALGFQQVPLTDPTSSPFTASFDDLATHNLDRWHTPGLAIAVVNGEDIFSKVWTPLNKCKAQHELAQDGDGCFSRKYNSLIARSLCLACLNFERFTMRKLRSQWHILSGFTLLACVG